MLIQPSPGDIERFKRLAAGKDLLEDPNITPDDVRREVALLRRYVEAEPDLSLLLKDLPDNWKPEDIGLRGLVLAALAVGLVPFVTGFRSFEIETGQAVYVPEWVLASKGPSRTGKNTAGYKAVQARIRVYNERSTGALAEYEAGTINLDTLNARLRGEVKGLHVSASVAGKNGGWKEMTFQDWGRAGAEIKKQYGFLDNLMRKVENGDRTLPEAGADLGKFGQAATASFERTAITRTGFPVEILPAVPGDGSTECYTRCNCFWSIRTLDPEKGNWDLSWRLTRGEHCGTCRKRADRSPNGWGNKRIRGFRATEPFAEIKRQ